METEDLISKAAEYTEKFVNAAVPVAKKAYEIGLLTIQIDAIQTIIGCLLAIIVSFFLFRLVRNVKKEAVVKFKAYAEKYKNDDLAMRNKDWTNFAPGWDGGCLFLVTFLSLIPGVTGIIRMCDIWLWVKLSHPDLWLAWQAIEKVLEVAGK